MERKEMKKRAKGLLALLLAFIMMFGTSLTVFAAGRTYALKHDDVSALTVGQKLNGGDVITGVTKSGGTLSVTVKSNGVTIFTGSVRGNDDNSTAKYTLPTGYSYKVNTVPVANEQNANNWDYTVELEATALPTSDSSKSKKKKDSAGTTYTHVHSYSWVTVQEAGIGQDGIEEYRCSCGDVQETNVIPATQAATQQMIAAIRGAKGNARIVLDTGRLYTMSDAIVKELTARNDISVEITFEYEKTAYKMTIPAGVDYTTILADEDSFYGYFYFAQLVGATIETKE